MDVYAKTWLQLAFPAHIIFLVIMIIWISSCSSKFSNLIGKKNPVATLATFILLSYTQLLETIIASLSFVPLKYPNGTTIIKWLPDASVEFSKGKYIARICVAILILILGLLYTIHLFLAVAPRCPRSVLFNGPEIRNFTILLRLSTRSKTTSAMPAKKAYTPPPEF